MPTTTFTEDIALSVNGGKDTFALTNTTANVGLTIGADTNLYRSSADNLKTDDTFTAAGLSSDGQIALGTATWVTLRRGTGDPEAVVTANPGSLFFRTDGGAGTAFYVKETGTGSEGWAAK
jgi:hypothetical protein